jgi:hypothetical protein
MEIRNSTAGSAFVCRPVGLVLPNLNAKIPDEAGSRRLCDEVGQIMLADTLPRLIIGKSEVILRPIPIAIADLPAKTRISATSTTRNAEDPTSQAHQSTNPVLEDCSVIRLRALLTKSFVWQSGAQPNNVP